MLMGRFLNGTDIQYRRNVCVLGNTAYKLLFEANGVDPLGKFVRIGSERFEVVGVFDKRPSPGGFGVGQDDFVVVPHTTYTRVFGLRVGRMGRRRHHHERHDLGAAARRRVAAMRRWPTSSGSCGSATASGSTSRTTSTSARRTRS